MTHIETYPSWNYEPDLVSKRSRVVDVFLDGKLIKAALAAEKSPSFGIFIHTLILSCISTTDFTTRPGMVLPNENEKAVALYTKSQGFDHTLILQTAPKIGTVNVTSHPPIQPSIHLINAQYRAIAQGTPFEILSRCTHIILDNRPVKITRKIMGTILHAFTAMAQKGLKVMALAIKDLTDFSQTKNTDQTTRGMTLVALVGISENSC